MPNQNRKDRLNMDETINDQIQNVEQLADDFVQAIRAGQGCSIEDYASAHPRLANQIRKLFPTILMMESARDQSLSRRTDGRVLKGPEPIRQLGDFQIIREIGRGGMGIVFEAIQQSLDRRVAVKVLPRKLGSQQIETFERESRLAAKLHHSNIVPVYGAGEDNGLHYFVMQLISGQPLSQFVHSACPSDPESNDPAESHLTQNQVCQIGVQTARAIHYAHTQGTLHRDIKPANLILDNQHKVWITDFGLAINNQGRADETETTTSGTLRYLPPEKLRGDPDTPKSDIYSLGITLIEILFGRPAFEFRDRSELIEQIGQGRICDLGPKGRRLPQDLEAILRKSIAVEPHRRYGSADEFADDLQRFLDDRPVSCRRSSKTYQLSRWRNAIRHWPA